MSSLPAELIAVIIEYACANDPGCTARRVGLVSKFCRDIAAPFGLRAIETSGLQQLRGAISRLGNAESAMERNGRRNAVVGVQHLFISELTKEHACFPVDFWESEEGRRVRSHYVEHTVEFWQLATALVKKTSPNLKSLCMLSSSHWIVTAGSAFDEPDTPKVLGALSGVAFPNLVCLTVNHDAVRESDSPELIRNFRDPEMPLLRKLCVTTLDLTMAMNCAANPYHPLLGGNYRLSPELTDLVVCIGPAPWLDETLNAVLGKNWQELSHKSLPGKLRSVTLQPAILPPYNNHSIRMYFIGRNHELESAIKGLHIDGLNIRRPVWKFPGLGKWLYEQALTDWNEQASHSSCNFSGTVGCKVNLG